MFKIHGYTKEYYLNKKLIGKVILEKTDRKVYGYSGRQLEVLQKDIKFKKLYKKGTEVYTEVSPICGKIKGSLKERIQVLKRSRNFYDKLELYKEFI